MLMAQLCPSWTLRATDGCSSSIAKSFTAKNFKSAMDFLVKCGDVAEQEGHHPDSQRLRTRARQLVELDVLIVEHALELIVRPARAQRLALAWRARRWAVCAGPPRAALKVLRRELAKEGHAAGCGVCPLS